jgi:hypothetical protein
MAIAEGRPWIPKHIRVVEIKSDQIFGSDEVIVDPIGYRGVTRRDLHLIGGLFAASGYYGIRRKGWALLIHLSDVEVL